MGGSDIDRSYDMIQPEVSIEEILERLNKKPYRRSIEKLKELKCSTPYEKLNILADLTSTMKQEINEFWQGVNIKKDKLVLDGDSVMMLFVYICSQA